MTATYGALLFAGECFFGASLILGLAWLIARQGSASQRHFVWACAFVAMLALPLAAALVPAHIVFHLPAAPVAAATDMAVEPFVVATTAAPAAPSFTLADAVDLLFVVWGLGVIAIAARTTAGLLALYRLHRRSVPHIPNGIDGEKFRGPHWQLRIRTAPGNEGPVTYGAFKSTVLLPKASVRWPRAQLEAVLLHEFAHVCRKDCLTRLIALIACAFYWPNPFVWSAAARLRHEAEIAADDAVLESGVRASSYADALVGLARDFGHDHPVYAGVGLSMAERSGLKSRVQAILSAAQPRMGVTRMDMLKVVALGAAVTAGLVLARPSLADSAPEAPVMASDLPPAPPTPDAPPEPAPAPDAVPAPPAPPAAVAPPAPPAPPSHKHHLVKIMRFDTPDGVKVMKWDGDPEKMMHADGNAFDTDEGVLSPQDEKALREAHKAMIEAKKQAHHMMIVKRVEIDKAVAEAMKHVRVPSPDEIRKMVADAKASRVRALEQARDEIDRQLAEARQEEANGGDDDDKGEKGPKGPKAPK